MDNGTNLMLAAAGSAIALASLCFSYARCMTENEKDNRSIAIGSGELLLQSASLFFVCAIQRYLPVLTENSVYPPAKSTILWVYWVFSTTGSVVALYQMARGFGGINFLVLRRRQIH